MSIEEKIRDIHLATEYLQAEIRVLRALLRECREVIQSGINGEASRSRSPVYVNPDWAEQAAALLPEIDRALEGE